MVSWKYEGTRPGYKTAKDLPSRWYAKEGQSHVVIYPTGEKKPSVLIRVLERRLVRKGEEIIIIQASENSTNGK